MKRECDIIILNQLQEMTEVIEDSKESSSNIKKLKFLTERMGLLRNFLMHDQGQKCALVAPRSTFIRACTINSKVNGTPKGVYLHISKLHSFLAVGNLLTCNNL